MNLIKKQLYLFASFFMICCANDYPDKIIDVKKKPINSVSTIDSFIDQQEHSTIKSKEFSNLITNANVEKKLTIYGQNNPENVVEIITSFGEIKLELFDDTPLHRANFIMLTKKGFFENTLFYRVVRNFMIQGGNSDRDNVFHKMAKIGNYRIPSEIKTHHIHKRGALSMAVQEQYFKDPKKFNKNSSPYNFFIVQKGRISDNYMNRLQEIYSIEIPESKRKIYRKYGGNPHLDGDYTVFGQVIFGMDVVDKINTVLTDAQDRPLENIILTIRIVEK